MKYMDKGELATWREVLRRCGVNKHPRRLTATSKDIQLFLLEAISSDPFNLPDDDELETWWNWYSDEDAS